MDSVDRGLRLFAWPILRAAPSAEWATDELGLIPFPLLLEEEPIVCLKVELYTLHYLIGQGW